MFRFAAKTIKTCPIRFEPLPDPKKWRNISSMHLSRSLEAKLDSWKESNDVGFNVVAAGFGCLDRGGQMCERGEAMKRVKFPKDGPVIEFYYVR